jgi:hypothetical protein
MHLMLVLVASCALLILGCGSPQAPAKPAGLNASATSPAGTPTPPPPGTPPQNSPLTGVDPNAFTALTGSYTGTIVQYDVDGSTLNYQNYTFALSKVASGSTSYAYGTFTSNGPIGNFTFTSYLSCPQMTGGCAGAPVNGDVFFAFETSAQNLPALSNDPFALQLNLALTQSGSSYTFDPTQSYIYVQDCGFTQSSCTLGTLLQTSGALVKH